MELVKNGIWKLTTNTWMTLMKKNRVRMDFFWTSLTYTVEQ